MLHITIEGTNASLVFMNNGSFTRKNITYAEALTLTKDVEPVKVIKEKSARLGTRIIKCYDVDKRCSFDIINDLLEVEKEIMEVFGENVYLSSSDYEDISDRYQDALELQWEKRDVSDRYETLQKELIALKPSWRGGKIKTAKEFYDRQREFEGEVRYCRDHHSNGM